MLYAGAVRSSSRALLLCSAGRNSLCHRGIVHVTSWDRRASFWTRSPGEQHVQSLHSPTYTSRLFHSGRSLFQEPANHAMAEEVHTGSCLCGEIAFEVAGKPKTVVICHCDNCKKSSGSAFMSNLFFLKSQVKITKGQDALKTYRDTVTESGNELGRSFCPTCGSSIFLTPASHPDSIIVASGTVDGDIKGWDPRAEVFCRGKRHFVKDVGLIEGGKTRM